MSSTHLQMLFNILSLLLFLPPLAKSSEAPTWIKAGYWYSGSEFPVPDIDSSLFTHLTCAFAHINSSTYELSILPSDETYISTFTDIVRQKNPTIITLLSIWTQDSNFSTFFSMATQPSHRTSFIESSIQTARLYGFHGLELYGMGPYGIQPDTSTKNMKDMGILFDDWRSAINKESKNSTRSPLILTMAVHYLPSLSTTSYPMDSIKRNLDWVHIGSYDYHLSTKENFTGAHSALFDPSSNVSTDYGIKEWIRRGLPAKKMVLGLAYHGYAWTLVDPKDNAIGSPARGRAITADGSMSYKYIKTYLRSYGVKVVFNASYVANYCVIGSFWIGFDDVEAIKIKIVFLHFSLMHNFIAQEDGKNPGNKRHFLLILLPTAATVTLVLVYATWYLRKRAHRNKGQMGEGKESQSLFKTTMASAGNANAPNLLVFRLIDLVEATNNFSFENKLGEGGYGPVYKGVLHNGQEIAVKRLSKTSTQGFEEFKNEVMLTAKLQHVNLAYDLWKCGKGMEFMDPSLDDTYSSCKLMRCMEIALLCVQENPADRPSMLELSSMLKNEIAAMNTPKTPAFSTRRDEDEVQESTISQQEIWSVGYWYSGSDLPILDTDSTLFTHLTCAFAHINTSTHELSISPSDEPYISTFTDVVRQKNPSIITLLSIWTGDSNFSTFFSMATQPSHRSSFIESSIRTARLYRFHGLDLYGVKPDTSTSNMRDVGILLDDWRTAINRESKDSTQSPLVLTMAGHYLPSKNITSYPMESIRRNVDWVHIVSYDYHLSTAANFTGAHSALYDPSSNISTDYGIKEWISRGLPADKMVLGLAYHGYAWTLVDPMANAIGSPGRGPAVTLDGSMSYRFIKSYMKCYGEKVGYNSTYVTNYCISGSVWIGYDDVEAIRTKVSYAREKGLLGYKVWQVSNDDNWVLSKAAQEEGKDQGNNKVLWAILLATIAVVTLLLGTLT
ncbi:hypothetical protein RHGRI_000365 [Rhododendron griersonianum]|uniref:GH18 domain-containing protein n=1 Tax=Rhododendron griersonianum TaxID=479676 RepID=A0AAV6LIH2_9ERIC|nr:hypothetical protein RHGRI_000365 [Rhododendron griersonianum]KAG5564149.1 hypothetical protein RHGRI_000365 [Rhododendron griersonianum]